MGNDQVTTSSGWTEKKFTPVAIVPKRPQAYPSGITDIAAAAGGIAEGTYPGSEQWLGKGDALRHIMWQALMAKQYGNTLANAAGQWHELNLGEDLQPYLHTADAEQMPQEKANDLHNNIIGRDIASKANTIEDIYLMAKDAVESGRAKYYSEDERKYYQNLSKAFRGVE